VYNLTVYDLPMIQSISPRSVLQNSKSTVFVTVQNQVINPGTSIWCKIDDQITKGAVIATGTVSCETFIGNSSTSISDVQLSTDGEFFGRSKKLLYSSAISLHEVTPSIGSVDGGTSVFVRGSSFTPLLQYQCLFGNIAVNAKLIDSQSISCIAPSNHHDSMPFGIAVDGNIVSTGDFKFYYYIEPVITNINPSELSVLGGESVDISIQGQNLFTFMKNGSSAWCMFGNRVVVGKVLNSTAVTCNSPPSILDGLLSIKISLNGADFFPSDLMSSFITYTSAVKVSNILPWNGPKQGGSVVDVIGTSFPSRSDYQCSFGNQLTLGIRISSTLIKCSSPSFKIIGTVPFSLRMGTETLATRFSFNIYDDILITEVFPNVIFSSSTPDLFVTLKGSGFVDFSDKACRVGSIITSAKVISTREMMCYLPPLLEPGTHYLSVALNGKDFTSGIT